MERRATHDIDLVVDLKEDDGLRLAAAFPTSRFYVSEAAVREAIRTKRMFNVLETGTGEKVDFWLLTDSVFDRARFARRRPV
jgi:hypothetical protein